MNVIEKLKAKERSGLSVAQDDYMGLVISIALAQKVDARKASGIVERAGVTSDNVEKDVELAKAMIEALPLLKGVDKHTIAQRVTHAQQMHKRWGHKARHDYAARVGLLRSKVTRAATEAPPESAKRAEKRLKQWQEVDEPKLKQAIEAYSVHLANEAKEAEEQRNKVTAAEWAIESMRLNNEKLHDRIKQERS